MDRSLNREIFRLAVPSILANLTVPLVGLVDIAITGHLGDIAAKEGFAAASFIGGITIGSIFFDLLFWSLNFLRTGTGGLTAQAFGRSATSGSFHEEGGILLRALSLSLLAGVLLIALQSVFLKLAFLVVDCSEPVRILASRYFRIRIWAAPATLSLFAFKGWFIGMQDTVNPMISDLIVNLTNVAASVVLAFGLGRFGGIGYSGVALGTVIAQWTGLTFVVCALLVRYRVKVFAGFTRADLRDAFGGKTPVGSFFSLNRDLFLHSLGLIAVYIGFTTISARFGDTLLSVSAILMKFLIIFSYFTDGFAYAGEAMTGKYIGRGDRERLSGTVRQLFLWSMGIAVIFIGIYALSGKPLLRLLTSDGEVIAAALPYLPWLMVMPLLGCPAFIWDGIYLGASAARPIRDSALLSAAGFFAVWFAGTALLQHFLPAASADPAASATIADLAAPATAVADTLSAALAAAPAASAVAAAPGACLHVLMAAYFTHLAVRTVYQTVAARRAVFSRL